MHLVKKYKFIAWKLKSYFHSEYCDHCAKHWPHGSHRSLRWWIIMPSLWLGALPSSWTLGSALWHFKHRTAGADIIKTTPRSWSLKFPQGKSCHTKLQENQYHVPNMGYTPRKKNMQTQQWQVLLAMNAVHCAITVQVETKVCRSVTKRN